MMFIRSQQLKSRVNVLRLSAHLVAATLLLGGVQSTWGQAAESRWSTSNPPTPAMVHAAQKQQSGELRRLPPIDQESAPSQPPSSVTTTEEPADKPQIAGQPQSDPAVAKKADPVNWSSPKVVIGPEIETRTVSHEEVVAVEKPQAKASRYSSAPQITQTAAAPAGQSRFTQATNPAVSKEAEPKIEPASVDKPSDGKPSAPVFARVFDEQVEVPGITQPEAATGQSGLSPIFACRLLGLRATKSEANTVR